MTATLVRLIDAAVQKHVFRDDGRVVGVNVSGGLDSSTVCRIAQKWRPTLTAFTGYYNVEGYDERRYARIAVGPHQRHREIEITPRCFVDNFDAMLKHFKPPWQGPGMFGQYMVAKFISEFTDIQVVLSGEGSDELFGGYARQMKVAGLRMPDNYAGYKLPPDYPEFLEDALEYDHAQLPNLLAVDNGTLGAFGLEGVAPFTDQAIVDYALALHPLERVGKRHLREAVRGIVPDPIIDRTDKQGFPVPLVIWANEVGNPVRDFVGDRLGYIPPGENPFDRGWWNELCTKTWAGTPVKLPTSQVTYTPYTPADFL